MKYLVFILMMFSLQANGQRFFMRKASTENIPPVANAGSDQTITLPTSTGNLVGTASSDADGSIATYLWSKISGPATYSIANTAASSTTATGLVEGTYVFRLTVTDDDGATHTDDVTITVNAAAAPDYIWVALNSGGANAYGGTNWNNWSPGSSLTLSDAIWESNGSASTIDFTLSAHTQYHDNGTGYCNSPANGFPTAVHRYGSQGGASRTLTITGLDDSKTYEITFLNARQGQTTQTNTFTVGAQSSVSSTMSVNTCTDATPPILTALSPSGGTITVTITATSGGSFTYLNSFKLKRN